MTAAIGTSVESDFDGVVVVLKEGLTLRSAMQLILKSAR